MCVIAYSPTPAVTATRDQLARACDANPDGFGWAVVASQRIVTHRTMDGDEAIGSYLDAVTAATGPSLFHARIASHGAVDVSNCHPFAVGGDSSIVLAHNGMLDINPGPFDSRSDTAILADEVLPRSGIETLDSDPGAWERWIGNRNKVVILSVSPRLAKPAYLLNEAAGSWDAGVWWSNKSYRPAHTWSTWPALRQPSSDLDEYDDLNEYDDVCEQECDGCGDLVWAPLLVPVAGGLCCERCAADLGVAAPAM